MSRISSLCERAMLVLASALLLSGFGNGAAIAGPFPVSYPAMSFLSARAGWVLAARGGATTVLRTSDAGRSWVRLAHLSLPFSEPSMQFVDDRHGWISTVGPSLCGSLKGPSCHTILLRTVDGGRSWRYLAAPTINGDAIIFVDPLHGWLIHSQIPCKSICLQTLYTTVDGGMTWRLLPAAPRFRLTSMSWVNRRDGWVGGGNPRSCMSSIFATTDGGRTWTRQLSLPRSCGLIQIGMLDTRRGWAIGGFDSRQCSMGGCDDYSLYQTIDGGKHWTTELAPSQKWWIAGGYAGGFPGPPVFVTPRYGWVPFSTGAGPGDGGIAITANGGRTWGRVLRAYSLAVSSVHPVNTDDGWIVGLSRLCPSPACNTDLLHTTDGGRTWIKLHPQP